MTTLPDLFADTSDGALAVDPGGTIVLWNKAAERILGYAARDVLGKRCCEVLEGRDQAGNRVCYTGCSVQTMVRMGERVQNYDMETRTKAGQSVWLNTSILVANGSGLKVTVHLFRDVTHHHRVREVVQEQGIATNGRSPNGGSPQLTRRELQILRLIADGLRTDGVADRLRISEATVRNHVQNILVKLDVHSRLEAVSVAMREHLV